MGALLTVSQIQPDNIEVVSVASTVANGELVSLYIPIIRSACFRVTHSANRC